uniref:Putative secreted protein n=1 Tax=Amblyomma triste TaxID=251400 RepID=A0A023G0M7_AMBTT
MPGTLLSKLLIEMSQALTSGNLYSGACSPHWIQPWCSRCGIFGYDITINFTGKQLGRITGNMFSMFLKA